MKDKLKSDMKEAMKAKDKLKLSVIRSLLSALQYEEMQKKAELSEDQILAVLKNELKKRKESLEFAEKDNRETEIEELNTEIAVVESYLPTQLSEDKLKEILTQFKAENADANMGQAMQFLKSNYAGQYDGKLASSLAKELL